jgi:hypothetical protein
MIAFILGTDSHTSAKRGGDDRSAVDEQSRIEQ